MVNNMVLGDIGNYSSLPIDYPIKSSLGKPNTTKIIPVERKGTNPYI
jgi:hypothetical protein